MSGIVQLLWGKIDVLTEFHFVKIVHVRLHMMQHKTTTLEGWVSKQHDGQIAADLKKNYEQFGTFLKTLSKIIEETVNSMRDIAKNPDAKGNRLQCTALLQKMIEHAMESSAVHNYGGVKWMAYIAVCDLEEFVLEPFGPIDSSMIPVGVYSHIRERFSRKNDTRKIQKSCSAHRSYFLNNTIVFSGNFRLFPVQFHPLFKDFSRNTIYFFK
jgi:hypothetical protein